MVEKKNNPEEEKISKVGGVPDAADDRGQRGEQPPRGRLEDPSAEE